MVALYGLVLAVGGPLPAPGTGPWWATRPVCLALLAAVLTPIALLLSRFERPVRADRIVASSARTVETPTGRVAVVLGAVLATLGLLGFTATGFTPLLDPEGTRLLILQVDPVQNLVHLVAGAYLARVALAGASDRPLPWLLTAAAGALPLTLPSAEPVTVVLHASVTALALTIALTRGRVRRRRPGGRAGLVLRGRLGGRRSRTSRAARERR